MSYHQRVSAPRKVRNIALIGFMGTGKSSVGQLVARQLGFKVLDTDALIEQRAGKSIARIFAEDGEAAFRDMERQVVAELAARDKTLIATGGGLGANAEHLASLKQHALVVCLWASPETIWSRVKNHSHRPLLQGPQPQEKIRRLLAERGPIYKQADVLMHTGTRSVREVAQHVIHQFRAARSGR